MSKNWLKRCHIPASREVWLHLARLTEDRYRSMQDLTKQTLNTELAAEKGKEVDQ